MTDWFLSAFDLINKCGGSFFFSVPACSLTSSPSLHPPKWIQCLIESQGVVSVWCSGKCSDLEHQFRSVDVNNYPLSRSWGHLFWRSPASIIQTVEISTPTNPNTDELAQFCRSLRFSLNKYAVYSVADPFQGCSGSWRLLSWWVVLINILFFLNSENSSEQECVIHGGLSSGMPSDACGGGQRSRVNVRLWARADGFNAAGALERDQRHRKRWRTSKRGKANGMSRWCRPRLSSPSHGVVVTSRATCGRQTKSVFLPPGERWQWQVKYAKIFGCQPSSFSKQRLWFQRKTIFTALFITTTTNKEHVGQSMTTHGCRLSQFPHQVTSMIGGRWEEQRLFK